MSEPLYFEFQKNISVYLSVLSFKVLSSGRTIWCFRFDNIDEYLKELREDAKDSRGKEHFSEIFKVRLPIEIQFSLLTNAETVG